MIRMISKLLSTLIVALACSTAAQAAILVDQELLVNEGFFARFGPHAGIAQSFKQVHDNITGASVATHVGGTGIGSVTIALYDALPTAGGSLLASGTVADVSAGDLATVDFGSVISITPEQTYFLVFTGSNGNMGVASTAGLNTGIDLYTRGQGYHSNYTLIPRNDINFQTFYSSPDVAPVPEPSSLAIAAVMASLGVPTLLRRWSQSQRQTVDVPRPPLEGRALLTKVFRIVPIPEPGANGIRPHKLQEPQIGSF